MCDWTGEKLVIDTSFEAIIGKLLYVKVWRRLTNEKDELVGCAELHITPERCVLHCTRQIETQNAASSSRRVALQLRNSKLRPCGNFFFKLDIHAGKPPVEQKGPSANEGKRVSLGRMIYAPVIRLVDDEIDEPSTANTKSSNVADDAPFLLGAFDDDVAVVDAQSGCQAPLIHNRNELRVVILGAQGLRPMHNHSSSSKLWNSKLEKHLSNPYVSLCLQQPGKVERTSVVFSTLDPEWGEQFILPLCEAMLADVEPPSLEFFIQNHNAPLARRNVGRGIITLGQFGGRKFRKGHVWRGWLQLGDEPVTNMNFSEVCLHGYP